MDFSAEHLEARGRGQYVSLPIDDAAPFWLILSDESTDSGKIHQSIKQKWLDGDSEVKETMSQIADTAEKGWYVLVLKAVVLVVAISGKYCLHDAMIGFLIQTSCHRLDIAIWWFYQCGSLEQRLRRTRETNG